MTLAMTGSLNAQPHMQPGAAGTNCRVGAGQRSAVSTAMRLGSGSGGARRRLAPAGTLGRDVIHLSVFFVWGSAQVLATFHPRRLTRRLRVHATERLPRSAVRAHIDRASQRNRRDGALFLQRLSASVVTELGAANLAVGATRSPLLPAGTLLSGIGFCSLFAGTLQQLARSRRELTRIAARSTRRPGRGPAHVTRRSRVSADPSSEWARRRRLAQCGLNGLSTSWPPARSPHSTSSGS